MVNLENLEGESLAQINLPFLAVSEFMQESLPPNRSDLENSSK